MATNAPKITPAAFIIFVSVHSLQSTLFQFTPFKRSYMLLECTVLQQNRNEYYSVDSLGTLFETIPEACIVEFLGEAGLFYLIWMTIYPEQPLIQISHLATRFWTRFNPSNTTRFYNLFIELNQLWENPTCEGRLICPGGHVSSLNKCNPIQAVIMFN